MAISKSLRFEILRRDGHACHYCGAKAPDVALAVDHVVPVSLGGIDSPDNLVTSCTSCNSGKGNTPPDAALVAEIDEAAAKYEAALARAQQTMSQRQAEQDALVADFMALWGEQMPAFAQYGHGDLPGPERLAYTLEMFLAKGLPWNVILGCISIAAGASQVAQRSRFRYFCGVCNVKIRELHALAADLAEEGP